jgi:CelD/BcsL family acetyltransferase involved in cellulose biosynthesis
MRVEAVTRRADLAALTTRWDELAHNDPRDGFFRTSVWYRAWIEHVRPDAEPFVLVVREDQRIVGLAPLCRLPYRDLGFRLSAIAWAGREVVSGDFLDFISERDARPEIISAILTFLYEQRSQWGLLVMGELVKDGASLAAVENLGERSGAPMRRQEPRICPYIAMPATFDEYLNSLSSSMRYHVRRRMRDIEKKGARLEVHSDPLEITSHLDSLIQLHLARWRRDNLPGTFGRAGFAGFLRQVCSNPPSGSSCRLYRLTHDGVPFAALLMFYFGESALYYQAGWDPDSPLVSHSPGVVVMAHSIRDAINSGCRYYEFLRGDEAYKLRWTKTYRETTTLLLGRSVAAKAYLRVTRLKDLIKTRIPGKTATGAPADILSESADLNATS